MPIPRRPAIAPSKKTKSPKKSPPRAAQGAVKRPRKRPSRPRAEQPLGAGVADAFALERLGAVPSEGGSNVREITWIEFETVVRGLAARMSEKFKPEVVLGVARGGVFVGGNLAVALRADFLPVRVEKRSRDRIATPTVKVPEANGKRVLVVDDVMNTGETLAKARALAKRSGAKEIQSASLVVRPGGSRPDWFALETAQLMVFPWDYQLDPGMPGGDPASVGV